MEKWKESIFVELLGFDEECQEADCQLLGQHDLVVRFHMLQHRERAEIDQGPGHPTSIRRVELEMARHFVFVIYADLWVCLAKGVRILLPTTASLSPSVRQLYSFLCFT